MNEKTQGLSSKLNTITLPEHWSKFLGLQPETGMGYQSVIITKTNGEKVYGIVLNGQFLETVSPLYAEDIVSIQVTEK